MNWNEFDLFNPTEEHRLLRETVAQWSKEELDNQALEYDRDEKFNLPLFRKLGTLGLLGITVSEEYGGSSLGPLAAVIAHEELSVYDPGFCLAYLAHSMLCVNNLTVNGNDEQKSAYLPGLSSGELVGAMAMSEPNFGTDVLGMETTAVKNGDHYILNGRKMWITNGCIDDEGTPCDLVWVYANTGTQNGNRQLSTFLVDKKTPGFYVGQKIKDKLGMRASNTAELVFDNCKVPGNQLVGQEGESIKHMMRNLEIERVTLAAIALGIARRCLDIMSRYASERHAFGKPINKFGQIQKHIADSYAEYQSCRAYVYNSARTMKIHGTGNRLDSDGMKLTTTTMAKNVADRAIQVLGGFGYVGEYHVERLWRDAKLLEIGGGTLEAHQKNITADLAKAYQ